MLRSCQRLIGYQIYAEDGPSGHLYDLYFNDRQNQMICGVVRMADERGPFVLISTNSFADPDHSGKVLRVALSTCEVRNAPGWDSLQPVYRQRAIDWWERHAPSLFGLPLVPSPTGVHPANDIKSPGGPQNHIRSFREISGYRVWGADGRLGRFLDFVVDDRTWALPYAVVEARAAGSRRNVLMPTSTIRRISWDDRRILTDISRKLVQASPYFEPAAAAR